MRLDTYKLVRGGLQQYARFDRSVVRARTALGRLVDGFVTNGLSLDEQTDLTVSVYDQKPAVQRGLFEWESAWFRAALPAPPAHVLLGGAGAGREAAWLRDAGYRVSAFEPAARAVRALERTLGTDGAVARGSYQDLIAAGAGQSNSLASLVEQRYDAIVVGWGSLSHVLGQETRAALLAQCHVLCPRGPILASFWMREAGGIDRASGRAYALGARIGRTLGRLRGVEPRGNDARHDQFVSHGGVTHWFTTVELEALAAQLGRSLEWTAHPYPHATWRPKTYL